MTRGARRSDDAGVALVLALALVTVLGLVIGGLLTYSAASVRATKAASGRAVQGYDVGGALQTAINQVRNSTYNNDTGQACDDVTFPRADGSTLTVKCVGAQGTGAAGETVPVTAANKPAQAVLALGTTAGEVGIAHKTGDVLRIQGDVFTNGAITTGTGTLQAVGGKVTARGTCTGTVKSSDADGNLVPSLCSAPAASIPADPDYPQPTAGLVYRPLPSCGSGSTVEFSPGYYDDAVGLSAMTNGAGTCKGKTFHFQPAAAGAAGVYYFDFHNGEGGGLPAGSRVWTINDKTAFVVGGTPLGWVPDVSVPSAVPGSCVSPLSSTANGGVRFVFGGDSRIRLSAGSVELCGQYSASAPPIAIHGAKTGADTVTSPPAATTDGTGTTPTGTSAFANPARIATTDGSAATATITGGLFSDTTASVVVKGFAPTTAIPAGSVLTAAKLVVVHRDASTFGSLRELEVTVTPTRTGATALADVPQPTVYQDAAAGPYHTDNLDLLASLAGEVHDNGFTGLQVRYDATVSSFFTRVTESLDSIQLVLSWRPPAVRGQQVAVNGAANCLAKYPAGCELLETVPTDTRLSVQGTIYAPYAAVELYLAGVTSAVVRSGIIVRSLQLQLTAAAGFVQPMVETPNNSPGAVPLEVYFRAYLAGQVVGTARARFTSADPTATPVAGRRSVTILTWTIRRK